MIVVFGSVNIDLVAEVERIAGPGETVLGPSYATVPGGKGANQALAARRAGAAVTLVAATGLDAFADKALSLLLTEGVDLSAVTRTPTPTGAAFICVDAEGQNAITVAAGANGLAKAAAVQNLSLGPADLLLLQREVPDAEGEIAARAVHLAGGRSILNLAPAGAVADSYLDAVDILVMNEHEAAFLAGTLGVGGDLPALAAHLHARHGTDCVVTLGPEGVIGWQGGTEHRAASLTIRPLDTTGAGDTFVGAFAAALHDADDFATALRRGAVAGSLACLVKGAQPSIPTRAAIDQAIKDG